MSPIHPWGVALLSVALLEWAWLFWRKCLINIWDKKSKYKKECTPLGESNIIWHRDIRRGKHGERKISEMSKWTGLGIHGSSLSYHKSLKKIRTQDLPCICMVKLTIYTKKVWLSIKS